MTAAFILSFMLPIFAPTDEGDKRPDLQALVPQIRSLEDAMRSGSDKEAEESALELMRLAGQLDGGNDTSEAIRISREILHRPSPAKARRQAFAILSKWVPQEVASEVTTVKINGPHTTCWGRFQDALDERLLSANDWILKARAHNTHRSRGGPNTFGTIAGLEFVLDRSKSANDLIQALKKAGFDLRSWTIMVETPIAEYEKNSASK